MDCIDLLKAIFDYINKTTGTRFDTFDELKANGTLDALLDANKVDEIMKYELTNFLNILYTPNLDSTPYLRKILLHETNYVRIFSMFGYMTSLYINRKDGYRYFPIYLKASIDKYQIPNFTQISYEELLYKINKYMDVFQGYDCNRERELFCVAIRDRNRYTNYDNYKEKIETNTLNYKDQTEFFILGEMDTYNQELNNLRGKVVNPEYIVRWVSKDHGDGYGFDVLSYDFDNNREKIMEVKTGTTHYYTLTPNEYRVARDINKAGNTDYYVVIYFRDVEHNIIYRNTLKYDVLQESFIDTITNDEFVVGEYDIHDLKADIPLVFKPKVLTK